MLFFKVTQTSTQLRNSEGKQTFNNDWFCFNYFSNFLGAWTSTNYAARACLDLPYCQGELIPNTNFKEAFNLFQTIGPNYLFGQMSNEARVAIHITHRIGAIVVFLYSLFLIFKLKSKETLPVLGAFGAILFLQVFLGIKMF